MWFRTKFYLFLSQRLANFTVKPIWVHMSYTCLIIFHVVIQMDAYTFGPWKIDPKEVFLVTEHCYAFVNLRPVVPGTFSLLVLHSHLGKSWCSLLFIAMLSVPSWAARISGICFYFQRIIRLRSERKCVHANIFSNSVQIAYTLDEVGYTFNRRTMSGKIFLLKLRSYRSSNAWRGYTSV